MVAGWARVALYSASSCVNVGLVDVSSRSRLGKSWVLIDC